MLLIGCGGAVLLTGCGGAVGCDGAAGWDLLLVPAVPVGTFGGGASQAAGSQLSPLAFFLVPTKL